MNYLRQKAFTSIRRKHLFPLLAATFIATSGCTAATNPSRLEKPVAPSACQSGTVLLLVAEESGRGLPGVQVRLIGSGEARTLGKTGTLGEVCIARSEFDATAEEYLTFCREGYFCGVFSVQKDIVRFDERIIALARVILR